MRMKPDWDLLAENVHPSVFVADVNCQAEESLCSDYHTGGNYPTVLVFRQNHPPELYQGPRGFEDLMKFVDKELAVQCSLRQPSTTCNEKELAYIDKWKSRGPSGWTKEIERLGQMNPQTMTYELSKWLGTRIQILDQLMESADAGATNEL